MLDIRRAVKAALFAYSIVIATSSWALDRNGNWWLTQSAGDRTTYIVGFFDGMEFELNRAGTELNNPWQLVLYGMSPDDARAKLGFEQAQTSWKNLLKAYGDFDGVTAGQLVAGVDAMFVDYRNRSISVKEMLEVVIWSIKGIKQEQIDGRLTYLRSQK